MVSQPSSVTEEEYLADVRARQQRTWPAGLEREISYPFGEQPLTEYLREHARRHPERAAYIYYGTQLTYGELDELSDRLAGFLIRHGIEPGDRVGVMLPNCPQFVIAFYGILKASAVHVPINPLFHDEELAYELEDSGAKLLLCWDVLAAMVERVRARTALQHVVATRLDEYVPESPTIPVHPMMRRRPDGPVEAIAWEEAIGGPAPEIFPPQDLDALAALNYTGGTTGMPKGCEHTQRHMVYTAACATSLRRPDPGAPVAVSLVFIPVFWIAGEDGAVIVPVFVGSTCVLLARWDPEAVLAAIDRHKVSGFGGTVENFIELMEHPNLEKYDLTSLRGAGAMPFVNKLSIEHRRQFEKAVGTPVVLAGGGWGMTETHTIDTFVTGLQAGDRDLQKPGFCGLPMPGTEFKIVDFDTGQLRPLGEEGEICCRTPSLMNGYWRAPKETAAAIQDGWLRTGDIGMIDEDGCLWFFARRKEMLKVNGMSVFPSELEVLLSRNPHIASSAVIGAPDPERGEMAVAFVQLHDDERGKVDEAEIDAWCRENMAAYKVPRIRIIDELPLTATGKVKKHLLAPLL